MAEAGAKQMTETLTSTRHYQDMQSAPRFPLHLAASVKMQGGAFSAETENISANGVLLAMDKDVPVGSMVDFTIMLPAEVVGARRDVQIDCRGRVVRSFEDRGRRGVGVVIDEYHFERA
ncbi:MAG TPA: PilZ domain-containing protein [Terriglobales bacterium]|nr:PilZ domain-containing protein [Terriglobales bacterium]